MRSFRINWAVILALIVLLGFTYFSFMGSLYSKYVGGDLLKAGLYALAVILLVATCVVIMCVSRATRWKEIGTAGQIAFAVVILAVFGLSAIPFTGFMKAIEKKQDIQDRINHVKLVADSVDSRYNSYVDARVASYEQWLRADSLRYAMAGGKNVEQKITNLKTSLENHLRPQSLAICQNDRRAWLSKIEGMSVWNVMLPRNLNVLGNSVNDWVADYVKLSDVSFDGQVPTLFKYENVGEDPLKELGEINISWVAILAALLSFFLMLVPYLLTSTFVGGDDKRRRRKKKKTILPDEVDYK